MSKDKGQQKPKKRKEGFKMTLKDILAGIPSTGIANGYDLNVKSDINIIDHQLEELAASYLREDDVFRGAMVTAIQSMFIAMTLDEVNWSVIKNAIEAVATGYDI